MIDAQVIIAGTDLWHDLLAGGQSIHKTLLDGGIPATLRIGLERFSAEQEKVPDVYVINAMAPRISLAGIEALAARVAAGTGLVTIHATNVTPPDLQGQEGFFDLIGSRFVNHPPFTRFTVTPVKPKDTHVIIDGVDEFQADDEPYEIELTDKTSQVLMTGEWGGSVHPIVYVRTHGKGRICYIALGHDGRAWSNPAFKKLVVQATGWCAADK